MVHFAQRLSSLRSNVFADMDRAKAAARQAGREIIDLSLGSSDLPTADFILREIERSLWDRKTHQYLLFHGTQAFREAAADWYQRRYQIEVNPETEVLPLVGSQEGTAHLPLALLNPGDYALLLDPGYPSHYGGVALAGGEIHRLPLRAERGFLPDFDEVPPQVCDRARMMVLNYPHNPTTATASITFFKEALTFCDKYNMALVHDFPYGDLVFNGERPPSILQADVEKRRSIEFFTLSKSYNMGGFRVGYAIGNSELILALRQVKAAVDFNQYQGIFRGAIAALKSDETAVQGTVDCFRERRDVFIAAMQGIGWAVPTPKATMYVWAQLPEPWRGNSIGFCEALVQETGVAASPGVGFGESGEGYVRFALVRSPQVLTTAVERISVFLRKS
ncbi:LL-diaminopimelate aminotransferase [Phormidium yuhuli AB48]|uniref:LL-diaminopimelate aminotransferase n=1 Tax=Phormidium yuhuli AB48 TaxID=2940671 RepID=A0ABY5AWU4_9CYAN|nr:LL-diaminopimelate aminotransferase [Phormidium yuhuli]USR92771.1 LL-diaminopimelate aminotransferase [Phormidium yuhuli AB48]